MRGNSPQGSVIHDCLDVPAAWADTPGDAVWSGVEPANSAARERLSRLARAIESDVQAFVADIVGDREEALAATLDRMRERGLPVEILYLELLPRRHAIWARCGTTTSATSPP